MTSLVSAELTSILSDQDLIKFNKEFTDADYGTCLGVYSSHNDNFDATLFKELIIKSNLYTGDKTTLNLEKINKDDNPLQVSSTLVFDASSNSFNYTGTWRTLDGVSVDFYSVKSGQKFSLWWMNEGGATNGLWTTKGLGKDLTKTPEVSHLTAFDDKSNNNVPEPSILSLFGLSLLGLGFIRRKKN